MVQSNHDYDGWKEHVRQIYAEKYTPRQADLFVSYISLVYDKHQKNFLPHRLMWRLFDSYNKVTKKDQEQWFGSFGRGGYGKTTVIKNVLYFLDPTFCQERVCTSSDEFIKVLSTILKMEDEGRFKAILLDEPSKETHALSKEWLITSDVLGQIRQANLFVGVCATDLNNVKSNLYSKLTGIFAFRKMFAYDYYDEEKTEGITGQIKKEYDKTHTYEVFHKPFIFRRAYLKNEKSFPHTPIDCELAEYKALKRKAFLEKVDKLQGMNKEDKLTMKVDALDKTIKRKIDGGMTEAQVAEWIGISQPSVCARLKKFELITIQ